MPSDNQRIALLEPGGTPKIYFASSEKAESSVGGNYVELKEIPFRIQLARERYLGGFANKTFGTTYVRFEYKESFDEQMFLIDKGRTGSSGLIRLAGLGRAEKGEDSIVAVKWSGKTLFETGRSPALGKDILYFAFYFHGGRTQLTALTHDNLGHAIEVVQ